MARRTTGDLPREAIAVVRISDDPEERAIGVGRQEQDCRDLAARLGWVIGEVIVENDTSAYKTKVRSGLDGLPERATLRPEYRRALQLLHAGSADGLIVYDIDRLARQPRDLEALIDVVETRGIPVASVTGSLDVSTSAGRTMSRVMVSMANKSSEDTARRVSRAALQRAQAGAPKTDGFRPYGYDRDMQIVPEEAAVVREVADRILAGDPVRSIAADLNARGIRPMRAAAWRNPAVKSIVRKPSVAGLRSYSPTSTQAATGAFIVEGTWEPILTRDTWEAVCAVLADRGGQRKRLTDKYLLSGIAMCGACGEPMYVGGNAHGPKHYRCNACARVSRSMSWVDGQVVDVVKELLDRPEVRSARATAAGKRPTRALAELVALRERRQQLLRDFAIDVTADDLRLMLGAVDDRIAALEAEGAAFDGAAALVRSAEFDDLPMYRRREIVRRLVRVTVLPAGKASRNDPESLRIDPVF